MANEAPTRTEKKWGRKTALGNAFMGEKAGTLRPIRSAKAFAGFPSDDLRCRIVCSTPKNICGEVGMPSYEVSNHARDGAQSG